MRRCDSERLEELMAQEAAQASGEISPSTSSWNSNKWQPQIAEDDRRVNVTFQFLPSTSLQASLWLTTFLFHPKSFISTYVGILYTLLLIQNSYYLYMWPLFMQVQSSFFSCQTRISALYIFQNSYLIQSANILKLYWWSLLICHHNVWHRTAGDHFLHV